MSWTMLGRKSCHVQKPEIFSAGEWKYTLVIHSENTQSMINAPTATRAYKCAVARVWRNWSAKNSVPSVSKNTCPETS